MRIRDERLMKLMYIAHEELEIHIMGTLKSIAAKRDTSVDDVVREAVSYREEREEIGCYYPGIQTILGSMERDAIYAMEEKLGIMRENK